MTLGPQFVYHGTARPIEGDRIVPAKEHGKGGYWGDTGSTRGEPAENHAWAHPDEKVAWDAAMDRKMFHVIEMGEEIEPRARVYALHPNEHQTPGNDASMAGELKAPHFDVAHPIDTMPGHQGTFPQVNWNEHVKKDTYLPGDEDANHPSHLSVQFGHKVGVLGDESRVLPTLHAAAKNEGIERAIDRSDQVAGPMKYGDYPKDDPLPGLSSTRGLGIRGRRR